MKTKLNVSLFVILGIIILIGIGNVSAGIILSDKLSADKVITSDTNDYLKADFNSKYGTIKITNTFLGIPTTRQAEYSLISNTEQCLIQCEAYGKAVLYSDGTLFDDIIFKDKFGDIKNINSQYHIKVNKDYEVEVPVYKDVCIIIDSKNETKPFEQCTQEVTGTETQIQTREVWKEYNGEILDAGNYEWKITAQKSIRENIDFIPVKSEQELSSWAWWNSSWLYKKQVNFTGIDIQGNSSTRIYVINNSNMKGDGSDLRFTNSTETAELPYWIRYSNSTTFTVFVRTNDNSSIYMYYGNAVASASSSKVVMAETDNSGIAWTVGGAVATNSTYGVSIFTRAKVMYLESNHSGGSTAINSRIYNNANTLLDSVINTTTQSVFDHSLIMTNNTRYKLVFTSPNQTNIRTYKSSGPAYNITFASMLYNMGVGSPGFTEDGDFYQYQGVTVIPYNDFNSTFSSEQSSSLDIVSSYPTTGSIFTVGSVGFGCNATASRLNITSIRLDVNGIANWNQSVTGLTTLSYNATFTNSTISDGSYSWHCHAFGSDGTNATTTNSTFIVDTTSPAITINNPLNTTYYSVLADIVNITATDTNGISSCWSSKNGAANLTLSNTGSNYYNTTNISILTGSNNVRFYCNDTSGNKNTAIVYFSGDSTAPVVNIVYPINATYIVNVSAMNYTITDAGVLSSCWYNTGGANTTVTCGTNITGLTSGVTNTWTVYSNDSFNNIGSSSVTFNLETIAPIFNYTSPTTADKQRQTNRTILINVSASDASPMNITETIYDSTFNSVGGFSWINNNSGSFFFNFTTSTDGTFYFNASVIDTYGNNAPTFTCFQETANVSTACGGLATGNYTDGGNWNEISGYPVNFIYDGNYNTYAAPRFVGDANAIINYTKPARVNNFGNLWSIKENSSSIAARIRNFTIPDSCMGFYPDNLRLKVSLERIAGDNVATNYSCWNGTWTNVESFTSVNVQLYEEAMNWNIDYAPLRTVYIDTTAPSITITAPSGSVIQAVNLTLLYSISDLNPDTCWFNYEGTNTTLNCSATSFVFPFNVSQSLTVYANDTFGFLSSASTSWVYDLFVNSQTYNSTTYETSLESFFINITYPSSFSTVTADLTYDGTTYAGTRIGTDNTTVFYKTLSMPTLTIPTNKSFFWTVNMQNATNMIHVVTTLTNQTVNPIIFGICNSTLNIPYINFTFKDENTLATINASFNSFTSVHYLGDGSILETLTYINLTTNPSYAFCFVPSDRTLSSTISLTYSNTGYPPRLYTYSYSLTNSTTNVLLYLLSSADGIPVFIQIIDAQGNKVSGALVTVTRDIAGNPTQIAQDTTGNDGGVSFFLSPSYQHTIVATKSGCSATTVSFTPSQPQYTVTMNCGGSAQSNNYFQSSLTGVTWSRGPLGGLLYIPAAGVLTNFTYRVDSQKSNIVSAKFEIVNQTLDINNNKVIVNSSTSTCTPSGCSLNLTYFVHPNEMLWGKYYVNLGNGYVLLEADARWNTIVNQPASSTTIKNLLKDFTGIFESWSVVNGEWSKDTADDANRQEYSRLVFFFLAMAVVLSLFSKFTGYDYPNPGVLLVGLTVFIFILSVYNGVSGQGYFYYSNLIPEIYNGAHWINNYILPLVCLLITAGIICGVIANKRG